MVTVKVGRRGQITIPSEIRRQMGFQEGDTIALVREGDHMLLRPITETLLDMRGSLSVSGPQDFEAIRHQVIAARARKVGSNES
jgi:AbrB family looped-hinge helix DNA binding protein